MELLYLSLLLTADDSDTAIGRRMLPIYVEEVGTYRMSVESAPDRSLPLAKEPVFEWLNPARSDQHGALFLWLRDGRPAALACIFSHPDEKLPCRKIVHELHALDSEKLLVKREQYNQWKPQAGLTRNKLPDAAGPGESRGARLLQLRRLAQEFTGFSLDRDGKRWDLRLLPTPIYRYPTFPSRIVDGALFALVSGAGTDPEVLVLIEAIDSGESLQWQYACGRFSDWELHVVRKGKEVYASIPSDTNPFCNDPLHLYRIYPEKLVSAEGKLLARIRQTAQMPWGEVIPAEEK